MKNMRRLAPAFVVLGVCVFIVSVWLSHIPSDAPSSSGSFNGSDSSPQYPGQADFAKSQDSFPASAAKSQKVANGSVEVKRKSPKTHEEVHAEYLQLVKELQSLNIAEAPALPLYNDCKRKLDDCDDALSENSSDVESILKQKCRVSEGLYLRLTDLANNSALWPVTNHYYANEAAKIYIACLKEYVPTCSSTEEAVTVYTNLGGLLDTYPEEVPGFEQKINSGMCFEKAFDLALDTGLCDLAEATMGAERFASGYDFDRAVRLLEKAISSCNSGRYVVRNYGPLTTSSEKAAAIKDLTNLIKEYESKKNSVDIGASKARIASFNDKSEKSRQAGLEREKLNYGVPVLKESLSGYKRWLFEKNYIESMKRDPVYKLLVEKRLAEQQLSGVPDLNSTAAHSSSVPSDSASSSAEQSSGSDSLFFALDRKSRSSDPEVNIEGLRQLEDFQPDDSGYPDSFAIATLKARFLANLQRLDEAVETLNDFLKTNPRDDRLSTVSVYLADLFMKNSQPEMAVEALLPLYTEAIDSGGASLQLCGILAEAYKQAGRVQDAVRVWQDFKFALQSTPVTGERGEMTELDKVRMSDLADQYIKALTDEP